MLVFGAACGRLGFDPRVDGGSPDGSDALAACTQWSPFTAPTRIAELSSAGVDWAPSISRDGLRLTLSSNRAGSQDLYVSTRATTSQAWPTPTILAGFGTSDDFEDDPTYTADELEIYFGKNALFRATRSSRADAFGPKTTIVSSPTLDLVQGAELSGDDLHLYFSAGSPIEDLYVMDRASRSDAFVTYTALPDPDPGGDIGYPTLSADELELFASSDHAGQRDIWTSRRADRTAPFPPVAVNAELSSIDEDWDPELSFDGATMYLASNRTGTQGQDIFVATRTCLAGL
jgi:Tol biopolymer transport system component